jgi:hypothetical protein
MGQEMYWKSKVLYDSLWEQFHPSQDAKLQISKNEYEEIRLVYLKSLTDEAKIQNLNLKPFYELVGEDDYSRCIRSTPNTTEYKESDDLQQKILEGILFCGLHVFK